MKKFLLSVAVILILTVGGTVHAQENFAVEVLNLVNAERSRVGSSALETCRRFDGVIGDSGAGTRGIFFTHAS